jgi:hypothetical protein
MNLKKARKRLHERCAISAVISNVILAGAVITVSFVVLFWAQYRSSAYNEQYSEAMNADIAKLKERLAFEYVFYDKANLTVYLLNCGTIDNVTVQTVYIYFSGNGTLVKVFSSPTLKQFNGAPITDQDLDKGEEGCFVLSPLSLETGVNYSVRVITGRGSTFEYTFIT